MNNIENIENNVIINDKYNNINEYNKNTNANIIIQYDKKKIFEKKENLNQIILPVLICTGNCNNCEDKKCFTI
jgi:hypothetical protein